MKKLLCPSMMCADSGHIREEIERLVEAGADMLHLDVMDGSYVPNFGLGFDEVAYICNNAQVPCDVHLMIESPARYVGEFAKAGVRIQYVHPESDVHVARTLQAIRDAGCASGIAINPGTAVCSVEPVLGLCDYVLVMTVNPGFAGQAYLPFVTDKVRELVKLKEKYPYQVIIDGSCSPEVIGHLSKEGADGFVLGTSALFGKGRPYAEIMRELREL